MAGRLDHYLRQLLQAFWLRPETALWRTFDCLYMEKYGRIDGASADLGCGDGVMSYIMAGGILNDFEVFSEVTRLDDYNDGADIFDCAPDAAQATDTSSLRYRFDWGLDKKQSLIAKAGRLGGFYRDTRVADLNQALPDELQNLNAIFSNILYWLDDPMAVIRNWRIRLAAGGHLMVLVPGEHFKPKAWLYYQAPHSGSRHYLNYFDRGYGQLIQHCYPADDWKHLFEQADFGVVTHRAYLTDPVIEIWNIGTRPIAPLLIGMSGRLGASDRAAVKAEWVDYFTGFFRPIIEGEFDRDVAEDEAAFHFFLLERP